MAPVPPALKAADLDLKAVYLTACNRLCRLLPKPRSGPGAGDGVFSFEYLDGYTRLQEPEQFTLTAQNVGHVLRLGSYR